MVCRKANAPSVAGVKIERQSVGGFFFWPVPGEAMGGSVTHDDPSSIQKITLGQCQYSCRFTGKKAPIGAHFIRLWINFHERRCMIEHHGTLSDRSGVAYREELLCKSE